MAGDNDRKHPDGKQRQALLRARRERKMARSAQEFVRGTVEQFYDWLTVGGSAGIPQGPPIWICGDCHLGNLGPIADDAGQVEIEIRDFDQTVIGNPAHDIVRLSLSLSTEALAAGLSGVALADVLEGVLAGYARAMTTDDAMPSRPKIPKAIRRAIASAAATANGLSPRAQGKGREAGERAYRQRRGI